MTKEDRNILVVIETENGRIKPCSLELITAAREIGSVTGGGITAAVLGSGLDAALSSLKRYELDEIICVDDEALAEYSCSAYTGSLYALISKHRPDAVMISADKNGKDFAPRLARRLNTGITANCVEIKAEAESGLIHWSMPAPGGIMATILCPDSRPQMATVCPGVFARPEAGSEMDIKVVYEQAELSYINELKLIKRMIDEARDEKDLADAEIIVAGGRGMGSPEDFELVRELAGLLGGAVGASRAAVDEGLTEQRYLIGQTGKVVHPKLYIACGISGALQHMVGVKAAECIVAINRDKDAPIFEEADYAVVADARKLLPLLIEQLKKEK